MNNSNNDSIDPDLNYDFYSGCNEAQCKYYSLSEYLNLGSDKSVSILNYNIRSFERNFDSFASGFYPNELPNIICLTETWFSVNEASEIPGYTGYHMIREG